MKFAHIGFGVKDLARSKDFYKQIFEALGLPLIDESEQSVRFGADGRAMFYIHAREAPPGRPSLPERSAVTRRLDAIAMT